MFASLAPYYIYIFGKGWNAWLVKKMTHTVRHWRKYTMKQRWATSCLPEIVPYISANWDVFEWTFVVSTQHASHSFKVFSSLCGIFKMFHVSVFKTTHIASLFSLRLKAFSDWNKGLESHRGHGTILVLCETANLWFVFCKFMPLSQLSKMEDAVEVVNKCFDSILGGCGWFVQ